MLTAYRCESWRGNLVSEGVRLESRHHSKPSMARGRQIGYAEGPPHG